MKLAAVLMVFALSLLAACQPLSETGAYSSGGAQLNIFVDTVGGDTSITNPSSPSNVSVFNNNGTRNVTVTIYGHNSSSTIVEVISQLTNATKTSLNNTFTGIDCVVVNQSQQGGVLVTSYGSGATIASFNASQVTAFNPIAYDGSNYVCPSQNVQGVNSSAFNVAQYSEYAIYTGCDSVATRNWTIKYWVSADSSVWVPGAVAVGGCNVSTAKASTQLTDKGVSFIKFNINQSDTRGNRVYAKLVSK